MKKILCIFLCFVSLVLLTGCGKNKLSCEKKEENEYLTYKYEIDFEKDKIDTITITWTYDFSNVEDFTTLKCLSLEDCINKVKGLVGMCESGTTFKDCEVLKEEDSKVVIKALATDEELENPNSILNKETEKEDAIEKLKSEGFTCE